MSPKVSPKDTPLSRPILKTRMIWVLLLVLAVAPLFPLSNFVGHSHWDQVRWIPFQDFALSRKMLKDIIGNVLWFMVFGYLLHYQLNRVRRSRCTIATVTVIAGGISLSIEIFQVFCHIRISSMTDVVCNVLGAGLGGSLAEKLPATTSIEFWLTRWLTPVLGQQRFNKNSSGYRQDLPLE
jgi:glycopeptide antibiotics resistance protein